MLAPLLKEVPASACSGTSRYVQLRSNLQKSVNISITSLSSWDTTDFLHQISSDFFHHSLCSSSLHWVGPWFWQATEWQRPGRPPTWRKKRRESTLENCHGKLRVFGQSDAKSAFSSSSHPFQFPVYVNIMFILLLSFLSSHFCQKKIKKDKLHTTRQHQR